ncbi:hypothetical protein J2S46_007022 [Kitasatospora herbaricolor]|nr:hypothetical protein [Kitasatospora herbaricolor]MDQ0312466.1 hypothetical protein [Kitasatospora herbaricolor]
MPGTMRRPGEQGLGEATGIGVQLLSVPDVRALLRPAAGEATG